MSEPANRAEATLPLSGVRILDFSRLLPGPWCTQLLGDMGAEVVKVEHRESGDPSRHNPPHLRENSAYFASVNANKRSLTLDLRSKQASEVVRRLFGWADVAIESFSVGTARRLGIDYDAARRVNDAIIYCSVSGFGQTGEWAGVPGHDLVVQAASGILSPHPGHMPQFQAGDYAAASMAVIGILTALRWRDRAGIGSYLDISMFDSLVAMGNIAFGPALSRAGGGTGEPGLHAWGGNPRYNLYKTRDGKSVAVCLLEARLWNDFCAVIGRPDLVSRSEDIADRHSRHGERGEAFNAAISAFCSGLDRDELVALMSRHALPVMAVADADEAVNGTHMRQRGMVRAASHPQDGDILEIGNPLARSGFVRETRLPAPALGCGTDEILHDLGYSIEEVQALRAAEVV